MNDLPTTLVDVQHVRFGHLDRTDGVNRERPAALLLRDDCVVRERDLCVEAVGEHPFVLSNQVVSDANVPQSETR